MPSNFSFSHLSAQTHSLIASSALALLENMGGANYSAQARGLFGQQHYGNIATPIRHTCSAAAFMLQ